MPELMQKTEPAFDTLTIAMYHLDHWHRIHQEAEKSQYHPRRSVLDVIVEYEWLNIRLLRAGHLEAVSALTDEPSDMLPVPSLELRRLAADILHDALFLKKKR